MNIDYEIIADGLEFPEGPIALNDGSVLVVELRRQTLTRIWSAGRVEVVAHLGGGPNGAAIGPDGAVYVVNNGGVAWARTENGEFTSKGYPSADYKGGSVQRIDLHTGDVKVLYEECDGESLQAPNDIVFDRSGGMWFTDTGKTTAIGRTHGKIFYAQADGTSIRCIHDGMITPNGIGLSPDESILYVSETLTGRVYLFRVLEPGVIAPPDLPWNEGVFGPLPGKQMLDSMAVEASGRLCIGTLFNGGVTIFEQSGEYCHIPFPDGMVTNVCFGGVDMRDAWITGAGTGKLFKCRWESPGLRLNFNA